MNRPRRRPTRAVASIVVAVTTVAALLLIGFNDPAAAPDLVGTPAPVLDEQASAILLDLPSYEAARRRIAPDHQTAEMIQGGKIAIGVPSAIDWSDDGGGGRSYLRRLHALMPVRDLAMLAPDDPSAARIAVEIVDAWQAANPRSAPADPMAWHDETTAQRLLTLVQLERALRETDIGADARRRMADLALAHAHVLMDPAFHSDGTNHGMFQDHALLAWATSWPAAGAPEGEAAQALTMATERLVRYLTGTVTPDGVHREHAPAYHQVIALNISRYVSFFRAIGDAAAALDLERTRARMLRYAIHVIQPDGSFPLVSDTFHTDRPAPDLFDDAQYRFAVTGGRAGTVPGETDAFFLDAGYAIMRDAWHADGRGTYLHLAAAYHGSYHKHADDLSVWVYHGGPLLAEAGPNGYDYDDPFTAYGFEASSHNVVLVDGAGVPRTDGATDAVRLVQADREGEVSTATGITTRLAGAVHRRIVRFDRSSRRIVIRDELDAADAHEYTVLWHLASGVQSQVSGELVELSRGGTIVARLTVLGPSSLDLEVLEGERAADGEVIGGWRLGGPPPDPAESLRFGFAGTPGITVITTTLELLPLPGQAAVRPGVGGQAVAARG